MLDQRLVEIVQDPLGSELLLDDDRTSQGVTGWGSLVDINIVVLVETGSGVTCNTDRLSRSRNLGELQDFLHRPTA